MIKKISGVLLKEYCKNKEKRLAYQRDYNKKQKLRRMFDNLVSV